MSGRRVVEFRALGRVGGPAYANRRGFAARTPVAGWNREVATMTKTILLVDPDPLSVASLRKILARTGHRVQLALDGRTALREFERLRPDLVLLQDRLPVLDGLEACRRMKQVPGSEHLAVVILTAPRSHDVLFETGCDAYIEKPFERDELLATLRETMAHASAQLPPRVEDLASDGRVDLPLVLYTPELTEEDVDLAFARALVDAPRPGAAA